MLSLRLAISLCAASLAAQTLVLDRVIELPGTLEHVQGIDTDGVSLWVSSVDAKAGKGFLRRFQLDPPRLEAAVEVQEGDRIHPGGIALREGLVWVPVAEYRRNSTSVIQARDARTLELKSSFMVSDHIGCLAAGPEGLMGANWDAREVFEWNFGGDLRQKRANPHAAAYQDWKLLAGRLIAGGLLNKREGVIDVLDPRNLQLLRRVPVGRTSRGVVETQEGLALHGRHVYLLPEDGQSRLFLYLDPAGGEQPLQLPQRQRPAQRQD